MLNVGRRGGPAGAPDRRPGYCTYSRTSPRTTPSAPRFKIKTETCVCVCVYVWVDVLYFCEQFCFQLVSVNRSVAAEWHAVAVGCVVLLVPPNGQIVFRIDYRFATNCRFTFCIFCLCMYILFLLFV